MSADEDKPANVTNGLLWDEIRYIRDKVDELQTRILTISGAFASISVAVAVFELLRK